MTQGVLQGLHADEIAVRFAEKMKAPLRNAITMIYTEQAYFYGKATLDSYEEAEIDKYKLHVTFDARTSQRCRSLDTGKIYITADASPGSNYLHYMHAVEHWLYHTLRAYDTQIHVWYEIRTERA